MKRIYLPVLLFFVGVGFSSVSPAAQTKRPVCTKCQVMAKLEMKLLALDYFKESDSNTGYDDFNAAYDDMEKFKKEKRHNPEEFEALVKLVAAAQLYDTESYLAASLSRLIESSAELKSIYEKTLSQIEPCRRQELTILVNESTCDNNLRKKGLWEKPGHEAAEEACVDKTKFSIESCLNSKAKATNPK